MLCESCKTICVPEPSTGKYQTFLDPFKSSFKQMKASAKAGCRCCALLTYYLESKAEFHKYELATVNAAPVYLRWWRGGGVEGGGAYVYLNPQGWESKSLLKVNLEFFTMRDMPGADCGTWTMWYGVPAHPLSESSVEMAKAWIEECGTSHTLCGSSEHSLLPSRLLDVFPTDGNGTVCLIDSCMVADMRGKYATLSHCWGQVERTTTTGDTLALMQQGVPISSLSPTFRNAVQVAQALGIRYLWIDSLCVIQDSPGDLKTELSRMAGIFANGYLTIAGPSSTNSQEEFLRERQAGLHYVQLGEPPFNLYLRKRVQSFEDEIQNAPLNRRAWVFQELQLSRRILYYGVNNMIWSCRKGWRREDSIIGAFKPQVQTLYHGQQQIMASRRTSKGKSTNEVQSLIRKSNWYHLVDEYSRKQLTYPATDKLLAISAIAQEVRRLTGDTYLAGLWKSDIVNGLLWRRSLVVYADISKSEMNGFVALEGSGTPSWSWAAYDGTVETHRWRHEGSDVEELVTLKSASVDDSTVPVLGGNITLDALCQEIVFDQGRKVDTVKILGDGLRVKDCEIKVTLSEDTKLTIIFDLAEERNANTPAEVYTTMLGADKRNVIDALTQRL
ncbi:HET-domain-containing protein [Rhizodiscina lignyota]|uniref:HET-domain-containing protein n=1 Tax=Rhizodiscina lignyota TaxID=1504668 RepID=A0A9P4M2G2_9PEZI|nr:HET-domain-containing protein [Rhizodiscina lignyota]